MKQLLNTHINAALFGAVLLLLCIGLIYDSGFSHIDKLLLVGASFTASYVLTFRFKLFAFLGKFQGASLSEKRIGNVLFVSSLLFIGLDLIALGKPPILELQNLTSLEEVLDLRANIHSESPKWMVYLSSFNLKAILPLSLFFLLITKRKPLYWTLLIIASLHVFGMLQKSYIVSLLIPCLIYVLLERKWLHIFKYIGIMGMVMYLLTLTTTLPSDREMPASMKSNSDLPMAVRVPVALGRRVLITPGEVVSGWFEAIPSKKPYLNGDGFSIIAKLKGTEFVNYNAELYPILKPEYAEQGLTGTVNTATFVREYSNWGYWGLIMSGLFLGLFFAALTSLFEGAKKLSLCLNLVPIFFLSSTSIFTSLLSGGWGVTLFLIFLFKNKFVQRL